MNLKFLGLYLMIVLTAVAVFSQAPSSVTAKYDELPNFDQVSDRVYRGAQPKKGGFRRLAKFGVKTVVNLRDDDAMAKREESEARASGLQYFNIPLKRAGRPTDGQVERVLAILNNTTNQPVFVHCRLGADRRAQLSQSIESVMTVGQASGPRLKPFATECTSGRRE